MKLGIAVDNLGPGQLSYEIMAQTNVLLGSRSDVDIIVFYTELAQPMGMPLFATMPLAEAYGFSGPIMATNLSTTAQLAKFPSCPKKLFLVWDLEWIRKPRPFAELQSVYGNPDLTLIARGEEHAKAIKECWNRDVVVMDGFRLGSILEAAKCQ